MGAEARMPQPRRVFFAAYIAVSACRVAATRLSL
ncbi:hypothetical protein ABIA30_001124 [Mycobacterium sp. MAA66]